MYVYTPDECSSKDARRRHQIPWVWSIDHCELLCKCQELNAGSLEEQPGFSLAGRALMLQGTLTELDCEGRQKKDNKGERKAKIQNAGELEGGQSGRYRHQEAVV